MPDSARVPASAALVAKGKNIMRKVIPPDARGTARHWIVSSPGLSHIYYALDPVARTMRLRHDTQVLIDGFPRSANTFAVESFRTANEGISVAHHLHDRRRIRRAVKRTIPVILVVRHPDGCVNSFLNAGFETSRADFLYRLYTTFHRDLLDHLSLVTIAEFSEVTKDWPSVIERFNRRFGTRYATIPDSEEAILKRVEDFGKSHAFGQATLDLAKFEKVVSRPSSTRTAFDLGEVATASIRQAAIDAYEQVMVARKADQ